jgi:hypothetical protein
MPLHRYVRKKLLFCCWYLFRRGPKKQTYPSEIFCCFVAGTTGTCHCIGTFGKDCCFVAGTSLDVDLKTNIPFRNILLFCCWYYLDVPLHRYLREKLLFCCWNLLRRRTKKRTYPSEIFCCFVAGTTGKSHCIGTFRKNCCFVAGTSLDVELKNEHTLPKYFVVLFLVPLEHATA